MKRFVRIALLTLLVVSLTACATSISTLTRIDAPPPTPAQDLTETINGYPIADPYRWLEDPQQAAAWAEAQNARSAQFFAASEVPGLRERLRELYAIGYVKWPKPAGGKIFYLKQESNAEQPKLLVRENGVERAIFDPLAQDPTGKTALDWYHPSSTGKYLAFGLSKGGDEDSTLHVLETATGYILPERVEHTMHASVAWKHDDSGFYYTYYPDASQYNRHVYFHRLGDDPRNDAYVFGRERAKTDWPGVRLSEDDGALLIDIETGATTSDAYVLDTATGKLTTLAENVGAQVWVHAMIDGRVWAMTSYGADNYRVVAIDPADPAPAKWREVLPERAYPLRGFETAGDKIVALYLENTVSRVRVYDAAAKEIGEIALPAPGSVDNLEGEPGSSEVLIGYTSFLYPFTLFKVDVAKSLQPETIVDIPAGGNFDPARFVVEYVEYPSYDGTWVPLFLVHRRDLRRDGDNPTVLYGYGGFGIEFSPYFSRTNMAWIERGGVFALAGLRGGGERGEAWHRAGMREKKFQVFKDFEYAMRYLIREKISRPARLAIRGGSNGGLLIGAMITSTPHLFGCAVGQVGLYDMVRFHRFPPAQLWTPEYGNADEPGDTGYMWAYSPYHQVLPGVYVPPTFIQTAESDTRVNWLHSAKFTAALQSNAGDGGPVLFWLQREAGHGQGMNWSDQMKETEQVYRFIIAQIGDPAAQGE